MVFLQIYGLFLSLICSANGLGIEGYHFTYDGEPIYIVGSGMEGIGTENTPDGERWESWKGYIDMLSDHQTEHVRFRIRFFPWSFCWEEPGAAKSPWRVVDPRKPLYDLHRFNPRFWELAKRICGYAEKRGVLVEFVLFDRCSLERWRAGERWFRHPWNADCGGPIKAHDGKGEFYTLAQPDNLNLFEEPLSPEWEWARKSQWFQQHYVKKAIDELSGFRNVYWEIVNEMEGFDDLRVQWVKHWIDFLHAHDRQDRPISFSGLNPFRGDEVYYRLPGLDIVQCHADTYEVGDRIRRLRKYGKPVMVDEAFWHGKRPEDWKKPSSEQVKIERWSFWNAFVAGGHTTAVCWQPFTGRPIHTWLRIFALFVENTRFTELEPRDDLILSAPQDLRVHAAASSGGEYVIYCSSEGTYTPSSSDEDIKLKLKPGRYALTISDPKSGRRISRSSLSAEGELSAIKLPPFSEDLVIHMCKEKNR
ncbi:hypothetical protein J7M22_13260 [Candidatus Poribacteria bacterium]|nr:hypothetical protein [Candidatus Poribacteria bacterium]